MPSPKDGPVLKALTLDALTETSKKINAATKLLNGAVDQFNDALKRLNLGVPVWVHVSSAEPTNNICEVEELGYAKVKGTWGVSIRLIVEGLGPEPDVTEWHFADAPRDMRIRAAKCFATLLKGLNDESLKVAARMEEDAAEVEEMSSSIFGRLADRNQAQGAK
jgi:hypothetical protein